MNVGIDAISFYTTKYYLDFQTFAAGRNKDPDKFYQGLGHAKMSVPVPCEDIITLAANSVAQLLPIHDLSKVALVIFATESGVDASRAAAVTIHKLLGLPRHCRAVEVKQACYGATFGLQMALAWLRQRENSDKQVLLIASDIAKYAAHTVAESSQGCGAVAMLLSHHPRVMSIDHYSGYCTNATPDFWRPPYLEHALVDGKLSCEAYMRLAEETCREYLAASGRSFAEHDFFCYHMPVAKLAERTHRKLVKSRQLNWSNEQLKRQTEAGLCYGREIGNCYTASLYLGVLSLLENSSEDLAHKLVGLYSYGSGSVAEFFAGRVVPCYQQQLPRPSVRTRLDARQPLSFAEYEELHRYRLSTEGNQEIPQAWTSAGPYSLQRIVNHDRVYAKQE